MLLGRPALPRVSQHFKTLADQWTCFSKINQISLSVSGATTSQTYYASESLVSSHSFEES